MHRLIPSALTCCVLIVSGAGNGQERNEAVGPTFEVASVKQAPDPAQRQAEGKWPEPISTPNHIRMYTTVGSLLRDVYHLGSGQNIIGPEWIQGPTSQYFLIEAKLADAATPEQLSAMLKSLLIERFKLRVRMQEKEEGVYFLEAAPSGLRLKEVPRDQRSQPWKSKGEGQVLLLRGATADGGWRIYSRIGTDIILDAHRISMPELASALRIEAGRPVFDQTGLTGVFDISMAVPGRLFDQVARSEITENSTALDLTGVGGASLAHSLSQLGLRLRGGKRNIQNLVIEHIDRMPVEN